MGRLPAARTAPGEVTFHKSKRDATCDKRALPPQPFFRELEHYLETKQINLNLSETPIGWY